MSGRATDGVLEIEYGFYPQQAPSKFVQENLNSAFLQGILSKTGNTFTVDSRRYNEYEKTFSPLILDEYQYEGKLYVRVTANSYFDGSKFKLSNGEEYVDGDNVWVEVQPIKWWLDETMNIMLAEKILFAGVQFKYERNYKGDFSTTDIKKFLDQCFAKDIERSRNIVDTVSKETPPENARKQNPYGFDFDAVKEEDIIRGSLESNIAVFLHGRSSEGKSARVKQFDPDCEIIYLRNATPESLNGKSVYNSVTGEMLDIPPTWYQKIVKKCEEEPDKIHIVFLDELTNALPSIQGMAFNIVLDGEVNGKWKLPENARIVAAGNDLKDSLAANKMVEPLFNRFAHVYINTTVTSWLKWASTPKTEYKRLDYEKKQEQLTIHPSIYAYVAYKSCGGQDVLRTPYNGEKPNADPRKWEMASKVLYATKKPEMLRALVGEELTRDFVAFSRQNVITVEDVINGNYTDSDLEMNMAEKFATAVGLSSVDETNVTIIRNFVRILGAEILATFDSLWTMGDEHRLEKIAELKMMELNEGGKTR